MSAPSAASAASALSVVLLGAALTGELDTS
jgi:hypothetical protein